MTNTLNDPAYIADLLDLTQGKRALGRKWNVHPSSVQRHRDKLTKKDGLPTAEKVAKIVESESREEDSSGNITMSKRADRIIPLSEWLAALKADGFNPADYNTSHGHSIWGQQPREGELVTLYANKFSATKKNAKEKQADAAPEVAASILADIRSFTYVPEPVAYNDESAVIMPADLQVGKVDWNGGSKETVAQALHSFHEFAAFCKEFRPAEICMVDAGDPIENVFNTPSQMGTNDLDLPHQIATASHIFLEGIKLFAPLTPSVRFAAVSSNHGAFRSGPKSEAGNSHSDFGIVIAEMLRSALTLNEAFDHVVVQTPEPFMESLYFQTSGSDIGVVHGHQAGGPDKLGEWWKGQTHGGLPVAKARILLAGHWHSLRIFQSGDGRWVIVGPSSDRGSTWFTNLKGEQSQSGMLAFTTSNNEWRNLRIL